MGAGATSIQESNFLLSLAIVGVVGVVGMGMKFMAWDQTRDLLNS